MLVILAVKDESWRHLGCEHGSQEGGSLLEVVLDYASEQPQITLGLA